MLEYFVWVTGLRGPEAQLWADKQVDGGGKAKPTLFIHELTKGEHGMSLEFLAAAYPFEVAK